MSLPPPLQCPSLLPFNVPPLLPLQCPSLLPLQCPSLLPFIVPPPSMSLLLLGNSTFECHSDTSTRPLSCLWCPGLHCKRTRRCSQWSCSSNCTYSCTSIQCVMLMCFLYQYPPITANEGDETNPMISFSISGGPFNITSDGSIVRTTMPVTYIQSRPYYLLTINVTKLQIGQENTSTCTPYCNATALLNVTVLPINTPCIFTSDWVNYCPTLASYIPVGSVVKTVRCVDTDLGLNGKVSYYMYGGNGYFGIDAITGNITVASSLVSSVSAQYTITIVAQDQGSPPLSATITMSFSIALDLNPPYFTRTVFKASASTTTPIGTSLLTVLAMDDDAPLVPAGSILYTIEPWTPPMPFSLDATTGRVYVNSSLSAANIQPFYTFLVKALDGYCWQAVPDAIVDITIVDIVKPRCVFSAPYYQSRTWLLYTANFSVGLWENATIGSLVIDLQNYTSTRLSNFSLISWSPGANPSTPGSLRE